MRRRGGPFPLSALTATLLSSFSHVRISKKEISRFGRRLRRLSAAPVYVSYRAMLTNTRVHIHERARPHFRKIMQLFPASRVSLRHSTSEEKEDEDTNKKGDRVRPPKGDI